MQQITAIGFDLFDTLITLQNLGYHEAMDRLVNGLRSANIVVEQETFLPIYRACRTGIDGNGPAQSPGDAQSLLD